MKCRHKSKYHKIENCMYEECFGYYLSEYDIYCSKCGKYLSHWAYGSAEPEYIIKYELKGFKKIKFWFKYYIFDYIKGKIYQYKIKKKYPNGLVYSYKSDNIEDLFKEEIWKKK